jgi:hypothetical protein
VTTTQAGILVTIALLIGVHPRTAAQQSNLWPQTYHTEPCLKQSKLLAKDQVVKQEYATEERGADEAVRRTNSTVGAFCV